MSSFLLQASSAPHSGWISLAKAMYLPSGDQTGFSIPVERATSCRASPPSVGSSQIPWFSPRLATNEISLPSGEKAGDVSL